MDYKVIAKLLQEVKEGSNDTEEKIVELMDLLSSVKVNLILADISGNGHSIFTSQYAKQRAAFYYFAKRDMLPIMIRKHLTEELSFMACRKPFDYFGPTS